MNQQDPDLEQRLSRLEAQLDRFSLTLHHWQQTQDHLQPMESRLSQLMKESGEQLERWKATDERHEQALDGVHSRLEELTATEARLREDAYHQIREFENTAHRELSTLRHLHDEPLKDLRAQAASLSEICVAASTSVAGFERAVSQFAAVEADVHLRFNQLSRDLQGAVAALRNGVLNAPPAVTAGAPQWPLEGVMRLHEELRESGGARNQLPAAVVETAQDRAPSPATSHDVAPAHRDRRESQPQSAAEGDHGVSESFEAARPGRGGWIVALAATLIVATALVFAWSRYIASVQSAVKENLNEADARARVATEQAAAARQEADRQIAEAKRVAHQAQIVSDVLSAPDLIRFNLVSAVTSPRANAQLLWSRSRGLVFTASRVPAAGSGTTYQLWLTTAGDPVSVNLFTPDESGLVTLAIDQPPKVPRPVTGVLVTAEPTGGSSAPLGPHVFAKGP